MTPANPDVGHAKEPLQIGHQWTYRRRILSTRIVGMVLYFSVFSGLSFMVLALCLPVHVLVLFTCGFLLLPVECAVLSLFAWSRERHKSRRIALGATGILLPGRDKDESEIEIEYWAITDINLKHNCMGRQLVIGYPSGAHLIFQDDLASRQAFKEIRRGLVEQVAQARHERGLQPPRREAICQPDYQSRLRDLPQRRLAVVPEHSPRCYYPRGSRWVNFELFFRLPAFRLWAQARTILFPDCCCRCMQPVSTRRNASRRCGRHVVTLFGVPYCQSHGAKGQPEGLWIRWDIRSQMETVGLALAVENPEFACQLQELNGTEEAPPPWIAYPEKGVPPRSWCKVDWGARWLLECWLPFWDALRGDEKAAYLDRHRATAEWREYLATIDNGKIA